MEQGPCESTLPEIDNDRAYDNWTPLGVIAQVAGGEWPERVKTALLTVERSEDPNETEPLAIELLRGIKQVFTDKKSDRLSTHDLVESLRADPDGPWESMINYGRGLDARSLSRFLKPFGIRPGTIRTATGTIKGYSQSDFIDSFERYLSEKNTLLSENPENYPSHVTNKDHSHYAGKIHPTQENCVADKKSPETPNGSHCVGVTDKIPVFRKEEGFLKESDSNFVDFDL